MFETQVGSQLYYAQEESQESFVQVSMFSIMWEIYPTLKSKAKIIWTGSTLRHFVENLDGEKQDMYFSR